MEYNYPQVFIILPLFVLIWFLYTFNALRKTTEIVVPGKSWSEKSSKFLHLFISLIGLAGMLLMLYAASGPRSVKGVKPAEIEVNDIYLVVDVSRSMLADDLNPNRLEVAKNKLREFAALRPKDRLGVIIFSEKVFTLLPLTTDPKAVDQILSDVRVGPLGAGTNIGDALGLAVARGHFSKTKNKVVILLTDGVSNVGNMDPIQAANKAKKFGIKVYTIGLASRGDAKIPLGKNVFGVQQYQGIPGGSVDIETLEKISNITGGKSFFADSENALKEVLEEIQSLEKTKIKSPRQVVYEDHYYFYFLLGFFIFWLSEIFYLTFKGRVV